MTPGARVSAAIEVLADIEARKRPAAEALKDWGVSHRFAGSGDRAAIGNLVFDCLRSRASAAYAMGEASPRALVLRTLVTGWRLSPEEVAALAGAGPHAPEPLSEAELAGLRREIPADAPAYVRGDYPEWLEPEFSRAFGTRAGEEGAALARRAPVDLRVNTLKADRDKVLKALRRFEARATPYSPMGIRIEQAPGPGRSPHVEAEPGHGKGWYEVQDEGSQLAALLSGASPRQQIIDLCAGSGGKTLALAALMENTGQLYAYDADRLRLAAHLRAAEAGRGEERPGAGGGRPAGFGQARRQDGPRSHRCALHRLRRVAAAPRRQMAALAPDARGAARRAAGRARRRGRAGQAGGPARLCHLLGAAVREPRSGGRLSCPPCRVQAHSLAGALGEGVAGGAGGPFRRRLQPRRCR